MTLIDTGYKIYAKILENKLEKKLEEEKKLSGTQMGFRKRKGTIDAIYLLNTAMGREIGTERGKVYALFTDIKGALDDINRMDVWRMLEEVGIEESMRWGIEKIYEKTTCDVTLHEEEAGKFEARTGVRQKCPISPTLFNAEFADL